MRGTFSRSTRNLGGLDNSVLSISEFSIVEGTVAQDLALGSLLDSFTWSW